MKWVAETKATRLRMPSTKQGASRMGTDKATAWNIECLAAVDLLLDGLIVSD